MTDHSKPIFVAEALAAGALSLFLGTIAPYLWQSLFGVFLLNSIWQFWTGLGWIVIDFFANYPSAAPWGLIGGFLFPLMAGAAVFWFVYSLRAKWRLSRTAIVLAFLLLSVPFQIVDPESYQTKQHYSYLSYLWAAY